MGFETQIFDNLFFHDAEAAKAFVESAGAAVKFLPSYSPDLSPIEFCWSTLKEILPSTKARTFDALNEAITTAVYAITDESALNWFHRWGLIF